MKNVLNQFIESWKVFHDTDEVRINSGDCGLAAIACHIVLKSKGIDTDIVMNDAHAWLRKDNVDYDTLYPAGYLIPVDSIWKTKNPEYTVTLEEAAEEWMPCDALGGYLLKGFLTRYGLEMPACLQHCIDNAGEYDSPEYITKYKASCERVVNAQGILEGFKKNPEGCLTAEIANGSMPVSLTVCVHGTTIFLDQDSDREDPDTVILWDKEVAQAVVNLLQTWIDSPIGGKNGT